jgi:hypothetical protein
MNMKNADSVFAAIVVVTLLLLSAWGNATVLLVASATLLVGAFVGLRADIIRRKLLALEAAVISAVAAAIAIVFR